MALIGTTEAAKLLGVTPSRIRQFVMEDRIKSVKVSGVNLIESTKLRGFKRERRGPKPAKKS